MMCSHEQQLRNPQYRDWVKAGLALKYLKDGIEEFVDDAVKDQRKSILEDVGKELGRPDATCDQCSIEILLPAHKRGRCGQGTRCFCYNPQNRRRPCPNDVCGRIYDKMVLQHMHGRLSWINTDSAKWCSSHWEIAKCFLDGGGYEDKVSAADTDCKGLLSIITNNMFVQRNVHTPIDKFEPKTDVFSKSKEARNEILHLASLQVPVEKFKNYVDVMIQLLEDKGKLHKHEHAKQAIFKLRQLKNSDLVISTEDEWKVRESALKAVQEKKQEALDEMDEKQKEMLEKLQIDLLQETLDKLSKTSVETTQSLSNRQESLEQRQTLLESTVKQMQVAQSETSRILVDLQQDLSNLKTSLNSSEEVTLSHKKKLAYLKHKKDLKHELCSLYSKHLSTIPVPPLLKKLDAKVNDFYMDVSICEELMDGHDTKQSFARTFSFRDIFYQENKRVENIFVLGDAGVGKSTWCLKLINVWLAGIEKQDSKSLFQLQHNERMMLEFDIVLFISLRHATTEVDLAEMIRNQIFDQTPDLFDSVLEILKEEPEKCLVIVDGLDEWNPPESSHSSPLGQDPLFPGRRDLNHCTVLTTSRPWKLDEIRPSHSIMNRIISIKGIQSTLNLRILAGKIVSRLNQKASRQADSKGKTEEDFVKEVNSRFHGTTFFPDLRKNPLIAIFMVLKWFKDGSLETTMAGNYSSLLENILDHEEGYRNINQRRGQKRKYDGRLSSVPYLEQVKNDWSKAVDMLPECIKKQPLCAQYSSLILKLSEIAFEGLFNCQVNTLVFSEELILSKLSQEEFEVAVKSGILSVTNVIGSSSLQMSKHSFLHKTFQEYMAAIFLVAYKDNNKNPFQLFVKYCDRYKRIYEVENVILFTCGMDTSLAIDMLQHIANIEYSKMCFFEYNRFPFEFRLKCYRELREVSAASILRLPLNAIVLDTKRYFEDGLELLKTSTNRITYMNIYLDYLSETAQDMVMDYFSPGHLSFSLLTTLDIRFSSFKCCCTRANRRHVFCLNNLKKLVLNSLNCICTKCSTSQKPGNVMLDFSECTNLKEINVNKVTSGEMVFVNNSLKKMKLEDLTLCVVRVSEKRTPVQGGTCTLEEINCVNLENSTYILNCTNFLIHSVEVKNCHMFKAYFVDFCHNGQVSRLQNKQPSQISSLVCKKIKQCKIEVGSGITIRSATLLNFDTIPNIPWGKLQYIDINQAKDLKNADMYSEILSKLHSSEYLMSVQCMGLTADVFLKLLKTIETTKYVENLGIIDSKETFKEPNVIPTIYGLKHLKLHGLNRQFLEAFSKTMLNLCNIETLELFSEGISAWITDMGYLPNEYYEEKFKELRSKKECNVVAFIEQFLHGDQLPQAVILSVQSLVNLRCLKCQGYTEETFRVLEGCLIELPHLEELKLSCFWWQNLENKSVLICLEKIKKLKTLSLEALSKEVSSAIADSFINLRITELIINDWDLPGFNMFSTSDIISSLPNLKMLKNLTVNHLKEDNFANLSTTIPKLKEIEYLMLHGNEKYWMPLLECDLSHLKTFVLKGAYLDDEEKSLQTFFQCFPRKGQEQTVKLLDTTLYNEETESKMKSVLSFMSQEWERVDYDTYNITLKTTK